MRRYRAYAFGVIAALVLAACSGGDAGSFPEPPDFTLAPTTTAGIDYSEVPLKGVPGKSPTTSVVFGPGQATVSGTVIGDDGLIAGATVQVERIVSGSVAVMLLQTAEDGTWTMPQVLGGRYRARAWRTPDLAQTTWTAVFVGKDETKNVQLKLRTVGGLDVKASIAPDPPYLGEYANLVVQITAKVVDERGIVRASPQDNVRVDLIGTSGWRVDSPNPTVTDGNGRAEWTLRCRGTGRNPLAVTVGSQTVPLDVNACVERPEETTTTTAEVSVVP